MTQQILPVSAPKPQKEIIVMALFIMGFLIVFAGISASFKGGDNLGIGDLLKIKSHIVNCDISVKNPVLADARFESISCTPTEETCIPILDRNLATWGIITDTVTLKYKFKDYVKSETITVDEGSTKSITQPICTQYNSGTIELRNADGALWDSKGVQW